MEEPLSTLIKQFQQDYQAIERSYMDDICLLLKKEHLSACHTAPEGCIWL